MNVSALFIRQPVATVLLMVATVVFGALAYFSLPVSELPNVDYPTIQVSALLLGADPQTMASAVATPLESQLASIPDVASMSSQSSQDTTSITIQFDLDRNIDAASQDVQAAIQAAAGQLPTGLFSPPTYRKVNPADPPIVAIAVQSDSMPHYQLGRYAEEIIARQISSLRGVANVSVYGPRYAVRVQVDPVAAASRGIGIDQIAAAIQNANVNAPTGLIDGPSQTNQIHADGELRNAAAFQKLIIAYRNGVPIRLRDIGRALDGQQYLRSATWYNGQRAIVLAVQRQPGSNAVEIVDAIRAMLPRLRKDLPESVSLTVIYDRSESIRNSIFDVQFTLILAVLLVVSVIFLFLRNASAAVIPSLALPVAMIGTFGGMALCGYSLDTLSLMALTLSTGFVVDDAIVMLENIVRHIEAGESPHEAAFSGAREVGFTILSMTASLAAVFIPIIFMGGIVGRLLHEFAVTIVFAIILSGVVSITLTPMLCSHLLNPRKYAPEGTSLGWSERWFQGLRSGYQRSLHWCVKHGFFVLALFGGSVLVTVVLYFVVPEDFLPSQDTGKISVATASADRTSFKQMVILQKEAADIVSNDPNVQAFYHSVGAGVGGNSGSMLLTLKPRSERALSADRVIDELRPKLARVPGINVYLRNPPAIQVGGIVSRSQYQYTLQDLDQAELETTAKMLLARLAKAPGFVDVTSDMDFSSPATLVRLDRDRAASLNVSASEVETALGSAFGGTQISTIYTSSNRYWVVLELLPQYQSDPSDLDLIYVTPTLGSPVVSNTASGAPALVPLSAVAETVSDTLPLTINHLGQRPAITLSFGLQNGVALSDAVRTIERTKNEADIPPGVEGSFQGTVQAYQSSLANMGTLIVIGILTIYVVLGILYGSFIHPLTILSGLPSAAVGAMITLYVFGIPLSLYAFVGIIMLIGIVKKNAIMMIDFALHKQREEKCSAVEAIVEAAVVRFRPIMMTTMAALAGALPIAFGLGAGFETRQPLGLAVVGGLLLSQLLTLYITPVIYIYLDALSWRIALRIRPSEAWQR